MYSLEADAPVGSAVGPARCFPVPDEQPAGVVTTSPYRGFQTQRLVSALDHRTHEPEGTRVVAMQVAGIPGLLEHIQARTRGERIGPDADRHAVARVGLPGKAATVELVVGSRAVHDAAAVPVHRPDLFLGHVDHVN